MDRFNPPTRSEEQYDLFVEQVFEQLYEELGREPTDDELDERIHYLEANAEPDWDVMAEDFEE